MLNSPLLGNGSVSMFLWQQIDAVADELLKIVIYIQFASKLVQFRRVQLQVILCLSFITMEEKTLVDQ
jgi:hypothetical protein